MLARWLNVAAPSHFVNILVRKLLPLLLNLSLTFNLMLFCEYCKKRFRFFQPKVFIVRSAQNKSKQIKKCRRRSIWTRKRKADGKEVLCNGIHWSFCSCFRVRSRSRALLISRPVLFFPSPFFLSVTALCIGVLLCGRDRVLFVGFTHAHRRSLWWLPIFGHY